MKAYTSRQRFDERRRFTGVFEEMGRVRLDADANELTRLTRTDARRRSGDLAEGSPDDGFRVTDTHLLDPILGTAGWAGVGLPADDQRVIPEELELTRRDPETLPHVVRARGFTRLLRTLPVPLDLLHLPVPLHPQGASYAAAALRLPLRFVRPPTDDEVVDVRLVLADRDGTLHSVAAPAELADQWTEIRVPTAALAAFPRSDLGDGVQGLPIRGWGLSGLPPRAEVYIDGLLAEDPGLGQDDFILRGGDGTVGGAGRLYLHGRRVFIEHDWRYSLQPDLPSPPPLPPPGPADGFHYLIYADVWERVVHGFQDALIREPALDGDDTTFRARKVCQVRARRIDAGVPETLPGPTGGLRLSTTGFEGLPDRFPPERPDPCRDRCLATENLSLGEGYRGGENLHFRIEILRGEGPRPIVGWSRDNAAVVAPLRDDTAPGALSLRIGPEDATRFQAGDVVVVEDELSRLDPDPEATRAALRVLSAVDTATGVLHLRDGPHALTEDPDPLIAGGPLGRGYRVADAAAVRRWDGADWLLTGVRYNLNDGIAFAFSGADARTQEYWSFAVRVQNPDGGALGSIEELLGAPVHGPWHVRAPIGRIRWTVEGGALGARTFEDLRRRFLPLHEVRDRLIELGRSNLAPGAFTVVVGDGVRTFGDIDQNLAEGVTGDEALQAALDRIGNAGGTIYIRAGIYHLEHPVLIQSRSMLRILGDGDATELRVSGAGGAFYLDWCGRDGAVAIERLRLVEVPEEAVPIGIGGIAAEPEVALDGAGDQAGGIGAAIALRPVDLLAPQGTVTDLIDALAGRVRTLPPGLGRASASVVRTIARLRRLQRLNPAQPLEDVAPDELEVLRTLPHGVVTVSDSSRVRLAQLNLVSREQARSPDQIVAGVLVTGSCADLRIDDNRIQAPLGIAAVRLARFLTPLALSIRPRSGLFVQGLRATGNRIPAPDPAVAQAGIRIADGVLEGVRLGGNRIDGFPTGIEIQDQAELRPGEPVDRTLVHDNRITGGTEIGIRVSGDGVDLDGNEVRLGAGDGMLRAGIQLTGAGCRVRGNWITLPAAANGGPLAVEAGVLVGLGVDDGGVVARPAHDLEIAGNRIEGAGPAGFATGILIGGPQPVFDLRIHDNALRGLGDAGLRAWGHAGAVGGLRIEANRIDGVAQRYRSWGADAVRTLAALAPTVQGLADGLSPREVLAVLLAVDGGGVRRALDAVLRWLETATLRGGIALSLVEQSLVRDNRIGQVGTRQLPAGFVGPGAEARTAGIAIAGGADLDVSDNRIEQVLAPVERLEPGIGPVIAPVRPPVFEFLDARRLRGGLGVEIARDTHGAVVALRRDLMDYAAGDRRARQRIGGRIYVAMESLESALEQRGGEGRRLARELSGAIARMRESQGQAEHTRVANLARAVLSDAASLTADSGMPTEAWSLAANFDHAILGDDETVVELATDIGNQADRLLEGLSGLDLDLSGLARGVISAPGDTAARLALARSLGTLAEARDRRGTLLRSLPEGGLTERDQTVLDSMVQVMNNSLAQVDTEPDEGTRRTLGRTGDTLVASLRGLNPELAERVRMDVGSLVSARTEDTQRTSLRLAETLGTVRAFAADPVVGTTVDRAEVETQAARFNADLVVLTAESLERRVGALALGTEAPVSRELRVLGRASGQLVNLVSADDQLAERAREVDRAIARALEDVAGRTGHLNAARAALGEIQRAQATLAGVELAGETAAERAGPAAADLPRLAGLGQLLLELNANPDPEIRRDGAALFRDHVTGASEELGLTAAEREGVLRPLAQAAAAVGGEAPVGNTDAAMHTLAGLFERLGERVADGSQASAAGRSLHVLSGALSRGLDAQMAETDRVIEARRWVESNAEALSVSTVDRFRAAATSRDVLGAVATGLSGLSRVPPLLRLPPRPDVRFRPQAADGCFAAGVGARLDLSGNRVEDVGLGIGVRGASGHLLTELEETQGLRLAVDGNRINGAAVSGLYLECGTSAQVTVRENRISASAGIVAGDATPFGQSVLRVEGGGELALVGNGLEGNGHQAGDGLLHEIAVDWRGDVMVQQNRVRHAGGGGGGSALLVMAEAIDPGLVGELSRRPALEVEPPPETGKGGPTPGGGTGPDIRPVGVNDFVLAGLGGNAAALQGGGAFALGGLRLTTRALEPDYARLRAAPDPGTSVELAAARGTGYLALEPSTRDPLLGFLDRLRPPPRRPRPRARRAVSVVANDLVANGPALLVLAQGGALVSASVVGNELESTASTGAAYLRNVDTTLFSDNRCECRGLVNVAVIRSGRALVSVTGNTLSGAEPPTPATPPLPWYPPPLMPVQPGRGSLHLGLDLGTGSALTVELDSAAVLAALEQAQDRTSVVAAQAAEAAFERFAGIQNLTIAAAPAAVFRSGEAASRLLVTNTGPAPSVTLSAPSAANPTAEGAGGEADAGGDPASEGVTLVNRVLQDPDLGSAGKLFGVARQTGFSSQQARVLVQTQLQAAGGNEALALDRGLRVVLGTAQDSQPAAAPATSRSLLEELVAVAARRDSALIDTDRLRPDRVAPPPPDPRDHSLVLIGGTRVGAINNLTTAGVHVHDADQSIENNL